VGDSDRRGGGCRGPDCLVAMNVATAMPKRVSKRVALRARRDSNPWSV
jgi:hypothetical protein